MGVVAVQDKMKKIDLVETPPDSGIMVEVISYVETCEGFCSDPSHYPVLPFPTKGWIESGSPKHTCDGKGIARLGDPVISTCGHYGYINSASTIHTCDGLGIARIGDTFSGVYTGEIKEPSGGANTTT
jgi:uncharacterized Zn-binding protein involved in type VI secretion